MCHVWRRRHSEEDHRHRRRRFGPRSFRSSFPLPSDNNNCFFSFSPLESRESVWRCGDADGYRTLWHVSSVHSLFLDATLLSLSPSSLSEPFSNYLSPRLITPLSLYLLSLQLLYNELFARECVNWRECRERERGNDRDHARAHRLHFGHFWLCYCEKRMKKLV